MDCEQEKHQIQRFLHGKQAKPVDAFHIYQWIERCHFQEWWEMAIALSPYIPPGSLNLQYQKRLEVILKECRIKQHKSDEPITHLDGADCRTVRKIVRRSTPILGSHSPMGDLYFDNEAKQTLCQIYSVLYYMQRNHDFVDAVRRTKDNFNIAYNTVDDKCARRFAGSVDTFQRWYLSGEILQRLKDHFHLSNHDYRIFEELLTNTSKRDL
jgi:hypothetical protein